MRVHTPSRSTRGGTGWRRRWRPPGRPAPGSRPNGACIGGLVAARWLSASSLAAGRRERRRARRRTPGPSSPSRLAPTDSGIYRLVAAAVHDSALVQAEGADAVAGSEEREFPLDHVVEQPVDRSARNVRWATDSGLRVTGVPGTSAEDDPRRARPGPPRAARPPSASSAGSSARPSPLKRGTTDRPSAGAGLRPGSRAAGTAFYAVPLSPRRRATPSRRASPSPPSMGGAAPRRRRR